jgi:hypothetical protein
MSTKTTIVVIAGLLTALAGPAFAGDQNLNTSLRDGGRYVPEMNEPASHFSPGKVSTNVSTLGVDFQAQGTR